MQRDLLITDTKGFIAANVEGSVQCDQKRGRWFASPFELNTNPMNTDLKIDFLYSFKNGSYYLSALVGKRNFYQYFDNFEEAEKFCTMKNNVIRGQKEDEKLIRGSRWL